MLTVDLQGPGNPVQTGYSVSSSFCLSARWGLDVQWPSAVWLSVAPACYHCLASHHSASRTSEPSRAPPIRDSQAMVPGLSGQGTEEGHCCSWLLSLTPTPLGRGARSIAAVWKWLLDTGGARASINTRHAGNSNQPCKQKEKHSQVYWMPRCLSLVVLPGFISLHSLPMEEAGK